MINHQHISRFITRPVRFGLVLSLLILSAGILFFGCRSEDESAGLSGPALSVDEAAAKRTEFNKKNVAQYAPGTEPGIRVTMDFSEYHIAGRPYGDWMLHASWRACRKGCPELVFTDVFWVSIDADGRGTALIPPEFLNEVFALAQQKYEEGQGDLGIWWNNQALDIQLIGDGAFREYYDVDLGQDGWTYELSAGAVAGGMQQILDALGLAWWPGAADAAGQQAAAQSAAKRATSGEVPQNLALALDIGRCIGVTETQPVVPTPEDDAATEVLIWVSDGTWTGNLEGLDGADAKCDSDANEPAGAVFTFALLSDDSTDAENRVKGIDGLPVYREDGKTIISATWNGLWDGTLDASVAEGTTMFAWTGTKEDGTRHSATCDGWNSGGGSANGRVGVTTESDKSWVNDWTVVCASTAKLYCASLR